jgi:hypothetical protein
MSEPGAAMGLWQWIAVGVLAWIGISLVIGVLWSVIARDLKRRHRGGF